MHSFASYHPLLAKRRCLIIFSDLLNLLPSIQGPKKYEASIALGGSSHVLQHLRVFWVFFRLPVSPLAPRFKSPLNFRAATRSSASTCWKATRGGMGTTRRIVVRDSKMKYIYINYMFIYIYTFTYTGL